MGAEISQAAAGKCGIAAVGGEYRKKERGKREGYLEVYRLDTGTKLLKKPLRTDAPVFDIVRTRPRHGTLPSLVFSKGSALKSIHEGDLGDETLRPRTVFSGGKYGPYVRVLLELDDSYGPGVRFACGLAGGSIRVWDLQQGGRKELCRLEDEQKLPKTSMNRNSVGCICQIPTRGWIASGTSEPSKLCFWDLSTRQVVGTPLSATGSFAFKDLAFSRTYDSVLVARGQDGVEILPFSGLVGGEIRKKFKPRTVSGRSQRLLLHPTNPHLFYVSFGGGVTLLDFRKDGTAEPVRQSERQFDSWMGHLHRIVSVGNKQLAVSALNVKHRPPAKERAVVLLNAETLKAVQSKRRKKMVVMRGGCNMGLCCVYPFGGFETPPPPPPAAATAPLVMPTMAQEFVYKGSEGKSLPSKDIEEEGETAEATSKVHDGDRDQLLTATLADGFCFGGSTESSQEAVAAEEEEEGKKISDDDLLQSFLQGISLGQYHSAFVEAGLKLSDLSHFLEPGGSDFLAAVIPGDSLVARLHRHSLLENVKKLGVEEPQQSSSSDGTAQEEDRASWRLDPSSVTIDKSRLLGRGSFGVVYRGTFLVQAGAVSRKLPAAVKAIMRDMVPLDLIEKEVKIMVELKHKYVLECYGCFVGDDFAYIVTDLCSCGSLGDYLRDHETPFSRRMELLGCIASGMAYLHSRRVYHRDLKPENILLTEELVPKICDFGIAKHGGSLSMRSGDVGTPRFMANRKIFTTAASRDIYAFGVMAYEILSQKTAFAALCEQFYGIELVKEIHQLGTYPNVEKDISAEVSKSVKEAIALCWSQGPSGQLSFDGLSETLF